jgi:hypothetical protein
MSPAKKKVVRKAKKSARKAKKVVRKTKKSVRKAKKVAGKKRARGKTARQANRVVRKAKRAVRGRSALHIVKRAAARKRRAATPPAFPQAESASPKQRLLFDLVRSHTSVAAAIQGLVENVANLPLGDGKWTVRETLLHLITRDRIRLREMERALRGITSSWQHISPAEQDAINAHDLGALAHIKWEEAVRLFHTTRRQLIEAIESVPEEPAHVWAEDHPFGWMMTRLPAHDRHHAEAIKRSRS